MNDNLIIYLATALGVAISIILPILRQLIPTPPGFTGKAAGKIIWKISRPYLLIGLISLIIALLLVAYLGSTVLTDWQAGLLAGYTADATLQKISKK